MRNNNSRKEKRDEYYKIGVKMGWHISRCHLDTYNDGYDYNIPSGRILDDC